MIGIQWRTYDDQMFVYCPGQTIRVDYADTVTCPSHIQEFKVDQRVMICDFVLPGVEYEEVIGKLDVLDTGSLEHKRIRFVTRNRERALDQIDEVITEHRSHR